MKNDDRLLGAMAVGLTLGFLFLMGLMHYVASCAEGIVQ